MYKLFEVSKILSLTKPGGIQRVNIEISAYTESEDCSILALVCDNGYLLFRHTCIKNTQPSIRQLNWFHDPEKKIKALSFDPSGNWLLLISAVATIYIIPVLHLLDPNRKLSQSWRLDNITEIKLNVLIASVTCVRWWQTLQGQQIAVIGSELGEISFVNLTSKKEVVGTYITVGIASLDILNDESHDTTYLLITGCNRQQWRLLLEEKKSDFLWPFSSTAEAVSCDGNEGNLASNDDKGSEQRPHRLSKFESGTFLTPQSGSGQNLVSAYNSSSCLLQVLEGDLDHMHLFSYKIPANCENIMLSDKLIFVTQNYQTSFENGNFILRIFSRKLAEICSENSKKKEHEDAEVQNFSLSDEVLAVYKQILHHSKLEWMQKILVHNVEAASLVVPRDPSVCFENDSKLNVDSYIQSEESFKTACNTFPIKGHLDGCLIILRDSVWECRPRVSPESLFLRLTATASDLPFAEKLGVMLGLDIHKLYEIAADIQLSCGQFAQAVHLYQLSKCPQLKRVAHFMSYGYLSELIAYIQVLFSTKSMELIAADKCHFANIAVHCFSQQIMEKVQERNSISIAFKKFLRENMYYDEVVALKLLAEQGLHDLLYYLAKVRGQQGLMVETLLSIDGIKDSISCASSDALIANGYENVLVDSTNEDYMKCMTSFHLLQFLASKPNLLSEHLQHLIALLPKMNIDLLSRVVSLYDPSRWTAKLAFRNIAASKHHHRYWSIDSIASFGSDVLDLIHNNEESTTEEDVIKFFIFVLLMLCHKMNRRRFDRNLMSCEMPKLKDETVNKCSQAYKEDQFPSVQYSVLSCGLAHSALISDGILYMWGKSGNGRLGNGALAAEYQIPEAVNLLVRLQVKVLSVSCGAAHTLALTDCGVFAWGSSRYGQLGAGQVQCTFQPVILESLLKEIIVAVQCGQYHSLALTKDGRVYSWGWGVHGQLGHGNPEDLYLPKVIEYLKFKPVVSVAAGQGHSVVLSQTGEVYTFGCGMFGQLGTGSVIKCSRPQAVVLPEPVHLVASGFFHVVAISKRQNIYSWGCNPQALRLQAQNSRRSRQHSSDNASSYKHGKGATTTLSSSSSENLQQTHLVPNLVDSTAISSTIIQVSCGSQHSSVLTLDGEVFTWGRNTEGQIGNGTRREQKIPSMMLQLNDRKLVNVICGADFTIALDSIGKVWGWGQNDSGQLGKKPTSEINSKPSSSSSSGRIITIRTNRRMITITQPCRQGLLRPVEIIIPHEEIKVNDFNSGSFDTEYSISRLLFHQVSNNRDDQAVPDLSVFDSPCYGPYALHAALKMFHNCCDSAIILNHCISFSDFQAAAKVCSLEYLYAQALEYQLKALISDPSLPYESYLATSLEIIKFYSRMIDPENTEANMKFIEHVIKFWVKYKLQLPPLETFFQNSMDFWSYPLSLLLFSDGQFTGVDSNTHLEFLSLLSSKFCLNIVSAVISQIQNGKHHFELMEHMMSITGTSTFLRQIRAADALTAWDDSIPAGRLWQELLHNMQKGIISHSTIHLTAGDVDILTKSLMSERLCHESFHPSSQKGSKVFDHGGDVIVFTCGHHYTMHNFHSSVLPSFRDSMQKLPYPLPQTSKLLFSGYQVEGVVPAACPRCVLTELKSEL